MNIFRNGVSFIFIFLFIWSCKAEVYRHPPNVAYAVRGSRLNETFGIGEFDTSNFQNWNLISVRTFESYGLLGMSAIAIHPFTQEIFVIAEESNGDPNINKFLYKLNPNNWVPMKINTIDLSSNPINFPNAETATLSCQFPSHIFIQSPSTLWVVNLDTRITNTFNTVIKNNCTAGSICFDPQNSMFWRRRVSICDTEVIFSKNRVTNPTSQQEWSSPLEVSTSNFTWKSCFFVDKMNSMIIYSSNFFGYANATGSQDSIGSYNSSIEWRSIAVPTYSCCPNYCSFKGSCDFPGVCTCDSGFTGTDCSTVVPTPGTTGFIDTNTFTSGSTTSVSPITSGVDSLTTSPISSTTGVDISTTGVDISTTGVDISTTGVDSSITNNSTTGNLTVTGIFIHSDLNSSKESKMLLIVIIASSVAGIALVLSIGAFILFLTSRNKKKKSEENEQELASDSERYASRPVSISFSRPPSTVERRMTLSDVFPEEKLGEGHLGVTYKGKWRSNLVAIKELFVHDLDAETLSDILIDIHQLKALPSHPNIVQIISMRPEPLSLVMEYMEHGSLIEYLHSKGEIPEIVIHNIVLGISQGMKHLHSNNLIHGNLAARNVMLTSFLKPKICDYGLYRLLRIPEDNSSPLCKWMAPETLSNQVYSFESDVWSFGITLIEIYTRNEPFEDSSSSTSVATRLCSGSVLIEIPEQAPLFVQSLMVNCFHFEPEKRPSFEQLSQQLGRMRL